MFSVFENVFSQLVGIFPPSVGAFAPPEKRCQNMCRKDSRNECLYLVNVYCDRSGAKGGGKKKSTLHRTGRSSTTRARWQLFEKRKQVKVRGPPPGVKKRRAENARRAAT